MSAMTDSAVASTLVSTSSPSSGSEPDDHHARSPSTCAAAISSRASWSPRPSLTRSSVNSSSARPYGVMRSRAGHSSSIAAAWP
jgi:hypothetical protein